MASGYYVFIIYQTLFLSIGDITMFLDCHQHLFAVLFLTLLCPSYLDKAIFTACGKTSPIICKKTEIKSDASETCLVSTIRVSVENVCMIFCNSVSTVAVPIDKLCGRRVDSNSLIFTSTLGMVPSC